MHIILPVAAADAAFVCQNVLPYVLRNIIDAEHIYIITAHRNFPLFQNISLPPQLGRVGVGLLDEDQLLPGLTFARVDELLAAKYGAGAMRTGWYMQQMLKLAFARSEYASQYYLSWDADTIPLQPIHMFDSDGHPFMALKDECHRPYFDTLQRLLALNKAIPQSFIAEHMLFESALVDEMLTAIEASPLEGNNWVEKIIAATDYETQQNPMLFSEFETYGTYTHVHHPGHYTYRHLNTLRRGGFFCGRDVNPRLLRFLAHFNETASFERYDKPHFPQLLLNRLLNL